ncbi:MAG: dihydroorotase [Prevotella sp.]|nr:dihydroorotase [Prevotella sp.]
MTTLIRGGQIVNEGHVFDGSIIIENDRIKDIIPCTEDTCSLRGTYDTIVDATECFVLPGIIDSHVHFREPGLTHKACIESESRAAAYGGVTSYMEMPNTIPQTTTIEALKEKHELARKSSHVNYSFFFGATNDNSEAFHELPHNLYRSHGIQVPGVKLFMGSSTGNMLVDEQDSLRKVFRAAAVNRLMIVAHCEDTATIQHNLQAVKAAQGDDPDVRFHPIIRDEEACLKSTQLAISLAEKHDVRLHIAHVSTWGELMLLAPAPGGYCPSSYITAEICVPHLLFSSDDYATKGTLIKCNPAIKSASERDALRRHIGIATTIATDHAPHLLSEKQGGCTRAASGMPMVQFSLPAMLGLVDEGVLSIEEMVKKMCHAPARLFNISERGFLRKGYKADITVVRPDSPWTVTRDCIQSRCQWSPLEGHTFRWRVEQTLCNGRLVYDRTRTVPFDDSCRGEALSFRSWPEGNSLDGITR